jgi:hypothetical protein
MRMTVQTSESSVGGKSTPISIGIMSLRVGMGKRYNSKGYVTAEAINEPSEGRNSG